MLLRTVYLTEKLDIPCVQSVAVGRYLVFGIRQREHNSSTRTEGCSISCGSSAGDDRSGLDWAVVETRSETLCSHYQSWGATILLLLLRFIWTHGKSNFSHISGHLATWQLRTRTYSLRCYAAYCRNRRRWWPRKYKSCLPIRVYRST